MPGCECQCGQSWCGYTAARQARGRWKNPENRHAGRESTARIQTDVTCEEYLIVNCPVEESVEAPRGSRGWPLKRVLVHSEQGPRVSARWRTVGLVL